MLKSLLSAFLVVFMILGIAGVSVWGAGYRTFSLREDFGTGDTSGNNVGQLGWTISGLCGGVERYPGSWPYIGLLRLTNSAGSVCSASLGSSSSSLLGNLSLHPGWSSLFIVRPESNTATYRIGFADDPTSNPPSNGIWYRFVPGTDTFLTMETRSGGVSSTKVSEYVPSEDKFMKLWISSVSSGEIQFVFDGIQISNPYILKAKVPSANMVPFIHIFDTSNFSIQFDYFGFHYNVAR